MKTGERQPIRSAPITQHIVCGLPELVLLPVLLILPPLLYTANAHYNLPLAAGVDERLGLGILSFFHAHDLNPHFFMYPTLYYYITYAFSCPFPFSDILIWGRYLNLAFVGLTAYIAVLFCIDMFHSRASGLIAAASIIASPTIVASGSYLSTDVLLGAATVLSIWLMGRYVRDPRLSNWLLVLIAIGLAIGCKWTAVILFIVYIILDSFIELPSGASNAPSPFMASRVGKLRLLVGMLVCGGMLCLLGILFPVSFAARWTITHHSDTYIVPWTIFVNDHDPRFYAGEFQHLRLVLIGLGLAVALGGGMVYRWQPVYRALSLVRLYVGVMLVAVVVVISCPFSVLTPIKFLEDIRAVIFGNVLVHTAPLMWRSYIGWAYDENSSILLLCGLVALVIASIRINTIDRPALLYVGLYTMTLAISHRGYPRYLVPLLPLVFVFAARMLIQICTGGAGRTRSIRIGAVSLLVSLSALQLWPKMTRMHEAQFVNDSFWNSYHVALDQHPSRLLFAGYAPSVELSLRGVQPRQIDWDILRVEPLGSIFNCDDVLIFDLRFAAENHIAVPSDSSVQILLVDSRDYGQVVLKKTGCGQAAP